MQGIGPAIEHPFNQQLGPYFTLAAFASIRSGEPTRLYLNYPPGFPLLLAIPQWLGLPDYIMLPVLSTSYIFLIYVLGRLLYDKWTGLLGATIVAITPVFLTWGTAFWSDLPGTSFIVGTYVMYLLAIRRQTRVQRIWLGGAAGAMATGAIFIKYSNVLALLPLFAYVVYMQRRAMFRSAPNWTLAAVVVIGLIGVGLYNNAIYGNLLETFYSPSRSHFSFPLFSIAYALGPSPAGGYGLIAAGKTLWGNFVWLLIPAVVGLARSPRSAIALLGGVFVVFLGLSSTFAWAPENVDTRYLLPLFASVGLFAARGCLSILDTRLAWRKVGRVFILLAIGVTSLAFLSSSVAQLSERNRGAANVKSTAQSVTAGSALNSVFLGYLWNDAVDYYGERLTLFYRRIDLNNSEFEAKLTDLVTELLNAGRPVYYMEDTQPPFRDSLAILRRHFDLHMWKNDPFPLYLIAFKRQ